MLRRLLNQLVLRKSIPLLPRYSDTEWQFLGTSRTKTLVQVVGPNKVTDPYASHAWVRGAMEAVAMNISSTPVLWYNSRDQVASDQDASKWLKLFEKPNPLMGLQQLFEATLIYMQHYGECMWVLDRQDPNAMPVEIQPFNGRVFEPVLNANNRIIGWYVQKPDGKKIPFNTWEVVYFKYFNPYDPIRGLSPLEAAQMGLDSDVLASQYNQAFFRNSALPGGVIEIEEELTDETFNRMKQQFSDHHQGVNKAHMMAILEGGAKYKQLVPSQKDMEFLNQKKWNRDEILACFKVPKLELGVWDDVNFAVAKVQAREFWVKNLIPKMRLLEYVLWSQLFSVTSTGNVYMKWDLSRVEALQGDLNEKIDMAFKLWQMGVPMNELNDRFDLALKKHPSLEKRFVMNNVFAMDDSGKLLPPPAAPVPPGQGNGGAGQPKPSNASKPKKSMEDYDGQEASS